MKTVKIMYDLPLSSTTSRNHQISSVIDAKLWEDVEQIFHVTNLTDIPKIINAYKGIDLVHRKSFNLQSMILQPYEFSENCLEWLFGHLKERNQILISKIEIQGLVCIVNDYSHNEIEVHVLGVNDLFQDPDRIGKSLLDKLNLWWSFWPSYLKFTLYPYHSSFGPNLTFHFNSRIQISLTQYNYSKNIKSQTNWHYRWANHSSPSSILCSGWQYY